MPPSSLHFLFALSSRSRNRSHRSFRIATSTASHLEFRLSSLIDTASHRRVRELRLFQLCGSASRLHTGKNPHHQYHYLHHILSFMPVRFQKENRYKDDNPRGSRVAITEVSQTVINPLPYGQKNGFVHTKPFNGSTRIALNDGW